MKLAEVAKGIGAGVMNAVNMSGIEVTGVTCDSRQVQPGFLFAALSGAMADGAKFIPQAIANGASAVLVATDTPVRHADMPIIFSANPRRDFARAAARFSGQQPEIIAAVTGTNGKTSVAVFLRKLWNLLGHDAGSLGTLGGRATGPNADLAYEGSLTTPDPAELHRIVSHMQGQGIEHLVVEASSHGLDQYRLDGLDISLAAFTNLSRDHLDYHADEKAYFHAKARLFSELMRADGTAVVNADAPEYEALSGLLANRGIRTLSFGRTGNFLELIHQAPFADGQRLRVQVEGVPYEVTLPLIGAFQASNALCAVSLAIASGCGVADCIGALVELTGVRGRLEHAGKTASGASVYVDYAHTPDALGNVLQSVRPHTAGRLHVVFGCGGDRDSGKRPLMGAAAATYADHVIVTDDNPRNEDPAWIRQQAMAGCPDAMDIGDRREAIQVAMDGLEPDDVLVVAGKGHEQGQTVGNEVRPFDDVSVIQSLMEKASI